MNQTSIPSGHSPLPIAVFASGRGSTFRAIRDALAAQADSPAVIALCVSNNPNPGVFDHAREAAIPTLRLSPRMFDDEQTYVEALRTALNDHAIGMIVLAGYMRQLPPAIVAEYRGRILNIHPALLPKFGGRGMYGHHVHEAVIAAGEIESGPTIHLVDEEYDSGPIVAQERIPVEPGETAESLAARVLEVEHRLYPRVVLEMAQRLAGERLHAR